MSICMEFVSGEAGRLVGGGSIKPEPRPNAAEPDVGDPWRIGGAELPRAAVSGILVDAQPLLLARTMRVVDDEDEERAGSAPANTAKSASSNTRQRGSSAPFATSFCGENIKPYFWAETRGG